MRFCRNVEGTNVSVRRQAGGWHEDTIVVCCSIWRRSWSSLALPVATPLLHRPVPGHQATPRLTRDRIEWGYRKRRKNITPGACVFRSPFAIASCVHDSRRGWGTRGKIGHKEKFGGVWGREERKREREKERKRERKSWAGVERDLYGCLTRRFENCIAYSLTKIQECMSKFAHIDKLIMNFVNSLSEVFHFCLWISL